MKNFSHDKKSIGVYAIKKGVYIAQASIKGEASKNYFYSTDDKIESELSEIEQNASIAINRIINSPGLPLPLEYARDILSYIIIQIARTPTEASVFKRALTELLKQGFIAYRQNITNDFSVEARDQIEKFLENHSYEIPYPAIESIKAFSSWLLRTDVSKYSHKILINKTNKPFITSDNPACMYNIYSERNKEQFYAISKRGLILYLPITPILGIVIFDNSIYKIGCRKQSYVEIRNVQDVDEFNKLVACQSENVLFFKKGSVQEAMLVELCRIRSKYKPEKDFKMHHVHAQNESLIGIQSISMYCKFKPSFIKLLRNVKKKERGKGEERH